MQNNVLMAPIEHHPDFPKERMEKEGEQLKEGGRRTVNSDLGVSDRHPTFRKLIQNVTAPLSHSLVLV